MSKQAKFVYRVQRVDSRLTWELGVFSSVEVAESNCKLDCSEYGYIHPDDQWDWQPLGDAKFCEIGSVAYYIYPMELDMRIRHEPV